MTTELLDQAGLPDPGLADDLDEATLTLPSGSEGRQEHRHLLLATDQRHTVIAFDRLGVRDTAEREGVDGLGLALDCERFERDRFETRARALEHGVGGQDLARR
ncbi:MAG: hypothetical protein L0221_17840, partial [Chloroflexi bacterium]|nr:hypothetical protein [Chloroflexota bacterium]